MLIPTLVITTKNRKDDLRKALQSALNQTAALEIIVIDDGSTDGTTDLIRAEFPAARLVINKVSTGYIAARNFGARLATGDVIFSIDDDACFSTPYVVEQTLLQFNEPEIGAVAIPFVNVNQDDKVYQQSPDAIQTYICARYIGTAHAVRRTLFLSLGGYREALIHQGEESDFCIRMLNKGYFVRLGTSDVIHHYESPKRDLSRMHLYGKRNIILFAWCNAPLIVLPLHILAATINGILYGYKKGHLLLALKGIASAYAVMLRGKIDRTPVRLKAYSLFRYMSNRSLLSDQLRKYRL
jgi:glycosyltransferase involved in cell wall biosynthesis